MKLEKDINNIIEEINHFSNIELLNVEKEINDIINTNSIDKNDIESLFDRMLSLIFVDEEVLKPMYFSLLEYYQNINIENANYYKDAFIDQFGDEKSYKKMNKKIF